MGDMGVINVVGEYLRYQQLEKHKRQMPKYTKGQNMPRGENKFVCLNTLYQLINTIWTPAMVAVILSKCERAVVAPPQFQMQFLFDVIHIFKPQ